MKDARVERVGESQFGRQAAGLLVAGLVLTSGNVLGAASGGLSDQDAETFTVLGMAVYVLVLGSLIVWKAAGNRIGWLFAGIGIAGSLRDRVDAGEVVMGWAGVVSETMAPSAIGIWVKDQRM